MRIIGLDFSINKPAACIFHNNEYEFISWPFGLSERLKKIFRESGVDLRDRTDEKYKGSDSSEKMRREVANAMYIANEIVADTLDALYLNETYIVFEGFSYASSGNVALQLGGYKYILMQAFYNKGIPFERMTTYAPITIKKTASCAKKGMGKKEMIDAFIRTPISNKIRRKLYSDPKSLQKKTGNWIDHLDDLVDAYWAVETYQNKLVDSI